MTRSGDLIQRWYCAGCQCEHEASVIGGLVTPSYEQPPLQSLSEVESTRSEEEDYERPATSQRAKRTMNNESLCPDCGHRSHEPGSCPHDNCGQSEISNMTRPVDPSELDFSRDHHAGTSTKMHGRNRGHRVPPKKGGRT